MVLGGTSSSLNLFLHCLSISYNMEIKRFDRIIPKKKKRSIMSDQFSVNDFLLIKPFEAERGYQCPQKATEISLKSMKKLQTALIISKPTVEY